jgi:predicted HAD superfamily Cof-like phosphohydrolase
VEPELDQKNKDNDSLTTLIEPIYIGGIGSQYFKRSFHMFTRVAEFHTAFGHPVALTPEFPAQSVRDLRISLIDEELEEYCAAFTANDRVEMADALADLLFVLAGAAVAYGIAPMEPFESPYDEAEPLPDLSDRHDLALRNEFAAYLRAEHDNDLFLIKIAIHCMMIEIFIVARQSSIPINAVFAEVCRSNMSKLLPDGSVLRRADGKILKPGTWSPPDIAAILQREKHV